MDWVNGNGKRCTAFDFPLKGILQEAVKNTEYWRLKDGNVSVFLCGAARKAYGAAWSGTPSPTR